MNDVSGAFAAMITASSARWGRRACPTRIAAIAWNAEVGLAFAAGRGGTEVVAALLATILAAAAGIRSLHEAYRLHRDDDRELPGWLAAFE